MTTPTQLREAADRLLRCVNDPNPEHVYFEPSDIELCAEYLRALASAQSDAEKGWFAWATKQGYDMDKTRTGDWCDNETSESQISYLAGHVQGIAAGIAAQPLYALDPQTGSVSLVTQAAKVKELEK